MKTFLFANIVIYIFYLLVIITTGSVSISNIIASSKLYLLLHLGAVTSFLHIFCIFNIQCFVLFLAWILLIVFAIYIYKYANTSYSLYLWCIFLLLWLFLGKMSPIFTF